MEIWGSFIRPGSRWAQTLPTTGSLTYLLNLILGRSGNSGQVQYLKSEATLQSQGRTHWAKLSLCLTQPGTEIFLEGPVPFLLQLRQTWFEMGILLKQTKPSQVKKIHETPKSRRELTHHPDAVVDSEYAGLHDVITPLPGGCSRITDALLGSYLLHRKGRSLIPIQFRKVSDKTK